MPKIKLTLTDREIPYTLNGLDLFAKHLMRKKEMDKAYIVAKVVLQMDILIHEANLCDSKGECAFETNKAGFMRLFEEQIIAEVKRKNAA